MFSTPYFWNFSENVVERFSLSQAKTSGNLIRL